MIYPRFQLKLIIVNLLTSLLCLFAVILQTTLAFRAMRDLGIKSNMTPDQPYFQFLDLQEKTFLFYLLLAFAGGSLVSLVATVIYSHRLAGPLVRLRRFFSEIRDTGEFPQDVLKFRKNDYFQDIAPIINDALKKLRK